MSDSQPRLLVLGAHPDDAEFHGGGIASIYRRLGRTVKMVSVTNGGAGHHQREPDELVPIRRAEAASAGRVIGAEYVTWDFPDGTLQPTIEVRERIIMEIRQFKPDLVLTHRTCDYHPDHRAVGQCVQDASYLVTVPHVVREEPALRKDPVVAYLPDLFTRPAPLRPDVVIDLADQLETIVDMLACHRSQVFEWLPWHDGLIDTVPVEEEPRRDWLRNWFSSAIRPRADRFRDALIDAYGSERGNAVELIEAFELSEYAGKADDQRRNDLFPRAAP